MAALPFRRSNMPGRSCRAAAPRPAAPVCQPAGGPWAAL